MKKVVFVMIVLLLVVTGNVRAADPNSRAICFWVSGGDIANENSNLDLKIGYRQDNIEFGPTINWHIFDEGVTVPDDQSNLAVGIFGMVHFPTLIDVNNPLPVTWLPAKLVGKPFLGISYLFDVDGKGSAITPCAGVKILDNLLVLLYEYSTYQGNNVPDGGRVALSLEFKF